MTPQEFAEACRSCQSPQRAMELLRSAADIVAENERLTGIAYRMKDKLEKYKAAYKAQQETISQYEEGMERLRERISDLEDELEEKRIELAQLGGIDTLIGRLKCTTERSEAVTERLEAVQVKADKPAAEKKQSAKPAASKGKASEKYFNEFWSEYPKKRSKQAALNAWKRLAPDKELHTKIMAALWQQKSSAEWKREGGQFIPYPATWLNHGCWNDEMTVQTEAASSEHSYDLNKLIAHAQENIPTIKES
ncbi:MAG: hypothetical protein ACI4J6_04120 [Oscillospiraceae bacterium]